MICLKAIYRLKAFPTNHFYLFYRSFQKTALKTNKHTKFSLSQANGVNIISRDLGGPGASLSLIIRSGSRYEPISGLAHLLQRFAFKNTERRSSLRIFREIELLGGSLFSDISRENLILSTQFLRENLGYFVELLAEVLTKTRYNVYELDEIVLPYALSEDKKRRSIPSIFGFDAVHELAFRRGLGRPLLTNERNHVTVEMIKNYAKKSYVKNNIVVLATNANQSELVDLIKEHFGILSSGDAASSPKSVYYGGENRIPFKSHIGHFLISFPRPAEFAPFSDEYFLLSYLLGMGSRVKWSYENSPFGNIEKSLSNGTTLLSTNFAYSDTGLFCIHVYGPVNTLGKAIKLSVEALRSILKTINDNDIEKAISQAKYYLFDLDAKRTKIHQNIGFYYLASGSLLNYESIVSRIEKITTTKIKSAISKMIEAKPSVVMIGDTNFLPYYDEL
ncbi:hypothetical protein PMAC_002902 [Pneumocystis sp. 'macacae']|nr:hypothetical protein PMAC_002902 [Pneumocystis sp. 'macacae']